MSKKTAVMDRARAIVRPLVEAGQKNIGARALAAERGISHVTIESAIVAERARLETLAELRVEPADLSPTAQKRIDVQARRQSAALNIEFENRVRAAVEQRLARRDARDLETIAQANALLAHQGKKPFTAQEFTSVLMRALHPDTSTPEVRLEAFKLVGGRKLLLREEGRIITLSSMAAPLPKTREEWDAARRAALEARRAKRAPAP